MSQELPRTYKSFTEWPEKSKQIEYTEETPLLAEDGTLLAKGWARHNVFTYNRDHSKPNWRKKEWDFFVIRNENFVVDLSFANISIGGYVSAKLTDLKNQCVIADANYMYVGGANKYILPPKGDVPNTFKATVREAQVVFDTHETYRTLWFRAPVKGKMVECEFHMDIMPGLENITTVLPFENQPTRYFMTTKQNCMPCSGTYKFGDEVYEFSKEDTFCYMDWGRVNTPYSLVWYWGNGSQYIYDEDGTKHIFGFEVTWAIGDESNATETCLFWDGKAHKIGAVDVKKFPKDRYMEDWEFISDDGRFNLTLTPTFDGVTDINIANIAGMKCHQVNGYWNGNVVLDDGKVVEIKNLPSWCEYVENKW